MPAQGIRTVANKARNMDLTAKRIIA